MELHKSLISFVSLIATIREKAPWLLHESVQVKGEPITSEMPPRFLERYNKLAIADIGEPTTACFLTGMNVDPKKWYCYYCYNSSHLHKVDIWKIWWSASLLESPKIDFLLAKWESPETTAEHCKRHAYRYLPRWWTLVSTTNWKRCPALHPV